MPVDDPRKEALSMSRACPTCNTAVIARGNTCSWCEGQLTPRAVTEHTMTVALSATILQAHARKEPAT